MSQEQSPFILTFSGKLYQSEKVVARSLISFFIGKIQGIQRTLYQILWKTHSSISLKQIMLVQDLQALLVRHSFWSHDVSTAKCKLKISYMLGLGANYVTFLPSNVVLIRFMDEMDYVIDPLVRAVEEIRTSCK